MAKLIQDKIDELFEDQNSSPEELTAFLRELQASLIEADAKVRRSLWFLLIAWALFFLIGKGMVSEGQILSFKVSKINDLVIAAPIVLGGLAYLLLGALSMSVYQKGALDRCYKHLLPKAEENNVHLLIQPPSFLSIESLFREKSPISLLHHLDTVWITLMLLTIFGLPTVAVVHGCYLLASGGSYDWYWNTVCISIGVALLLRGWLLIVTAFSSMKERRTYETE